MIRTRSANDNLHQIGGSILHKPSGLGIFGQYTHEETGGGCTTSVGFDRSTSSIVSDRESTSPISNPETDTWYMKPFWRKVGDL